MISFLTQHKDEPSLKRKLTFVLLLKSWNVTILQIDLDKIRYWSSHNYGIEKKKFYKQIFTPTMALAGTQEYKNAPEKEKE